MNLQMKTWSEYLRLHLSCLLLDIFFLHIVDIVVRNTLTAKGHQASCCKLIPHHVCSVLGLPVIM